MVKASPARRAALGFFLLLSTGALLAASCGGRTEDEPGQINAPKADAQADGKGDSSDDAADAGKDAKTPTPKDGGKDASPDAKDGGKDALPDYVDPGCPDAGPPITNYECDPYNSEGTCSPDMSCYPYIQYPPDPCAQEEYGATCIFAGDAGQGEPCGQGCKGGHVCVVSGQGTQCVELCNLNDPNPCGGGLVCVPVDIPGIGGCL